MNSEYIRYLASYLKDSSANFIDMVWEGNPYTGEGSEYPVINLDELVKIITEFDNTLP